MASMDTPPRAAEELMFRVPLEPSGAGALNTGFVEEEDDDEEEQGGEDWGGG